MQIISFVGDTTANDFNHCPALRKRTLYMALGVWCGGATW